MTWISDLPRAPEKRQSTDQSKLPGNLPVGAVPTLVENHCGHGPCPPRLLSSVPSDELGDLSGVRFS